MIAALALEMATAGKISSTENRLEALKGDRAGQYNIRVNKQRRICFVWNSGHAYNVEIIDDR
ncbi:MAG: type II toxin-antitoxin system RelE/ParE family toxin [Comamonas sp.]|nr:type II toxin-antitoxin system RelE/ParE family toxin [Comamonas sp.]